MRRRIAWLASWALVAMFVSRAGAEISLQGPHLHYVLHCQGCHLQDGRATPGSVPALAGSVGIFLRVPQGRDYLVRVPGVANAPLDDGELAALLNWVVERFGGEQAPRGWLRYTRNDVARQRHSQLLDVEETRIALLRAAHGQDDRRISQGEDY